mmetsp:Transcript_23962/g.70290  ORF Transcript_23962/g.70290 Transcript_23962/m.70290 type:complete len:226 (-) Transcript_23962:1032-1709(-)
MLSQHSVGQHVVEEPSHLGIPVQEQGRKSLEEQGADVVSLGLGKPVPVSVEKLEGLDGRVRGERKPVDEDHAQRHGQELKVEVGREHGVAGKELGVKHGCEEGRLHVPGAALHRALDQIVLRDLEILVGVLHAQHPPPVPTQPAAHGVHRVGDGGLVVDVGFAQDMAHEDGDHGWIADHGVGQASEEPWVPTGGKPPNLEEEGTQRRQVARYLVPLDHLDASGGL